MLTRPETIGNTRKDKLQLKRAFRITLIFTITLWLIKIIETVAGISLSHYGIYPRDPGGLTGILWAPLLHGSFSHLLANTAPLLILGTALLYGYPRAAKIVIPVIYIGSGLCVWLFARGAYHLGASGLTFGFMFFIFTIGILRRDRRAIALSMIVFFLYGGMIWGIFPTKTGTSFETHLFAAIFGVLMAILLKNYDPRLPEKRYSWEDEEQDDEETEYRTY